MPHVKISIGDLKCIQQADRIGKDDVYWQANLRTGPELAERYTYLKKVFVDDAFGSSNPEMVAIGTGQTKRFQKNVVFDADCATGSYVFGTIHFLERDTSLAYYFEKIAEVIGIIVGSLVVAALVGFAIGFGVAGLQGGIEGGVLIAALVALVGFFVGASIEVMRPGGGDEHLGGMRIVVGPITQPPPNSDKDTWPLTLLPSGKLELLDAHGAELMMYPSSHALIHGGHKYETTLQLEITGGHR